MVHPIGYVTNGGWIDSNTADGLRKALADEFSSIYVYNLRGNQRTAGEESRREGGKIFGSGSRNTVAITFLVKNPRQTGGATVYYRDIGDYLTREDKLTIINDSEHDETAWQAITPNEHGDWLNQRDEGFASFTPIGATAEEGGIFTYYSGGVKTNRDAWVYNYSRAELKRNVKRMVAFYNDQTLDFSSQTQGLPQRDKRALVDDFIDLDPRKFSWDRADKQRLAKGQRYAVNQDRHYRGLYRPFNKQHVMFDRLLNNTVYQQPRFFPSASHENTGIVVTGPASHYAFCAIATDQLPDLHLLDTGQFIPRWTYEEAASDDDLFSTPATAADAADGYRRIDNITDATLADYRRTYGDSVTKDDVFYYVYGLLHSPDYRERYAADLRKMLPRIPQVASSEDFRAFAAAGRTLADLHIGYETVEPYPLTESVTGTAGEPELYRVQKMRYQGRGKNQDRSAVVYNSHLTLSGIPDEAHRYLLGSRSAIDWVMRQYQVTTHKASGIVNDPNDWAREVGNPRYIVDLLKRVVTVSVETMRIVDELPSLDLVE